MMFAVSALRAETEMRSVIASELNEHLPSIVQTAQSKLPEWVRRTDFTVRFEEDLKPLWSIETIQPLILTDYHVLFTQDRYAHTTRDDTLNIGLGYRYLSPQEEWLVGVNAFYDYTLARRHKRIGVGAELMGTFFSVHANYYEAISGYRFYSDGTGDSISEKALDGWDVEGSIQVPYLPWMRANIKGYEWESIEKDNVYGYQLSLHMNITESISFEIGRYDDSALENNYANVSFRLAGPEEVEFTMADHLYGKSFFTPHNLKKQQLRKVRRHHDIVVERTRSSNIPNQGGVFIGRGT